MQFLEGKPTAYLDEITFFIWDEFGESLSERSVYNIIVRAGWSRKKCSDRARERSAELREQWIIKQYTMRADQVVFVDESANNERTGWRKYGWSPRGAPCYTDQPVKRSERWSILPCITIDGYLPGTLIFQGAVNAEMFMDWLAEVVLPQLRPGTILVMDNASIHRTEGMVELVHSFGVYLEYLPPYSPDFNPIELSFSTMKAFVRREFARACEWASFDGFLRWALQEVGGRSAREQYWHCGYRKGIEAEFAAEAELVQKSS